MRLPVPDAHQGTPAVLRGPRSAASQVWGRVGPVLDSRWLQLPGPRPVPARRAGEVQRRLSSHSGVRSRSPAESSWCRVGLNVEVLLPEHAGVPVEPLVRKLTFIRAKTYGATTFGEVWS